jgi:hypothetical protein
MIDGEREARPVPPAKKHRNVGGRPRAMEARLELDGPGGGVKKNGGGTGRVEITSSDYDVSVYSSLNRTEALTLARFILAAMFPEQAA